MGSFLNHLHNVFSLSFIFLVNKKYNTVYILLGVFKQLTNYAKGGNYYERD